MDDLNLGVVIAQAINFGILLFIFYKFLGSKITAMIEERRKMMKATQFAEEEAQAKLEEAEAEKQAILDEARKKAAEIEANSEELAKQEAKKIREKGEKEADFMLIDAKNQIEKEKLEMESNMKDKILNLAMRLNKKLFSKSEANKDFIENEYELLTK